MPPHTHQNYQRTWIQSHFYAATQNVRQVWLVHFYLAPSSLTEHHQSCTQRLSAEITYRLARTWRLASPTNNLGSLAAGMWSWNSKTRSMSVAVRPCRVLQVVPSRYGKSPTNYIIGLPVWWLRRDTRLCTARDCHDCGFLLRFQSAGSLLHQAGSCKMYVKKITNVQYFKGDATLTLCLEVHLIPDLYQIAADTALPFEPQTAYQPHM